MIRNIDDLCELVNEALSLEPGTTQPQSDSDSIKEWDSLGHLSVLVAIDEKANGAAREVTELSETMSVQGLYQILTRYQIILR